MRICSILLALLLAGCTSVGSKIVGDQTYAPKPKNYEMMVFIDADAPPENISAEDDYLTAWGGPFLQVQDIEHEFDVIGIVGSGGAPLARKKKILNNVKIKARNLGADAIIITFIGYLVEDTSRGRVGKPLVRSNAIRFKPE